MSLAPRPASADAPDYQPGARLPAEVTSPPVASDAPFTPLVRSLIAQLLPSDPPTPAQLRNAALLLHGISSVPLVGQNSRCGTIGSVDAPVGTTPAIAPLCWVDAQGVNVENGGQIRQTTAPPIRTALASSWDSPLLNAWGQVEGSEARALGITGIYAPQADLIRVPDWGRNLTVFGEDPLQAGVMAAAEVNGVQGKGAMAQIKHVAFYDGQSMFKESRVQDQAAHQLYLTPYEYAMTGSGVLPKPGNAASAMCSYARFELVPTPGQAGAPPQETAPAGSLACDHPFMNRIPRGQWKWPGFFASDYYFAMDSSAPSMLAGNDQEMPTNLFFGDQLVAEVQSGVVPLDRFKLALARILYQEERFHLLGHPNDDTDYLSPSQPADPNTPFAIPAAMKRAHAAVTERASEEGAVLLKNSGALPLSSKDLKGGVLVLGESAEYMPADPGPEQADGYPDRNAISPLRQLEQLAPRGSRITYLPYMPGGTPQVGDGTTVPSASLVTAGGTVGAGLTRVGGPGAGRVDSLLDFTSTSGRGQLGFGKTYAWKGAVTVPSGADDYTFQFQFSVPSYAMQVPTGNNPGNVVPPSCTGSSAPTFSLATDQNGEKAQTLTSAPSALSTIQTNPTAAGFTERGLASCVVHVGALTPGRHAVDISWSSPTSFAPDRFSLREPGSSAPSFRFAWSRPRADQAAALGAARHASKVLVFADCTCPNENGSAKPSGVNSLDAGPTQLIDEMTGANPNTVVVTNTNVATLMPWLDKTKAVLQMWYPGSEGGTSTARLLLGLATPSGHLTSTWPKADRDTIMGYPQSAPLYAGDTGGVHSERFDNNSATIDWTEGIFTGYRFFDRQRLGPLFAFGHGLSYTTFRYGPATVRPYGGGLDVSFDVTNTGQHAGATVPQVYLGPAKTVPAGVQQAVRALAGFDRVTLSPGETRHEVIHLGPGADRSGHGDRRAFQYWDSAAQAFRATSGTRTVWVGDEDSPSRLAVARLVTSGGRVTAGSPTGPPGSPGLAATGASTGLSATALLLVVAVGMVRRRSRCEDLMGARRARSGV